MIQKSLAFDPNITRAMIDESVFLVDGEIRISGENGNDFSGLYVEYYAYQNLHDRFIREFEKVSKGKWMLEWYCAGYMTANRWK